MQLCALIIVGNDEFYLLGKGGHGEIGHGSPLEENVDHLEREE
jgi:hypothetical protein